jgi:hypothetical protein
LVVFSDPKLLYLVIRKYDSTERAHQPPRLPIPGIQVRGMAAAACPGKGRGTYPQRNRRRVCSHRNTPAQISRQEAIGVACIVQEAHRRNGYRGRVEEERGPEGARKVRRRGGVLPRTGRRLPPA